MTHQVLLCLSQIQGDAEELEKRVIVDYQHIVRRIVVAVELATRILTGAEEKK